MSSNFPCGLVTTCATLSRRTVPESPLATRRNAVTATLPNGATVAGFRVESIPNTVPNSIASRSVSPGTRLVSRGGRPVSGGVCDVSGRPPPVSGFVLLSGLGLVLSGLGLVVSGFGLVVSGLGFVVSGFGLVVSGRGLAESPRPGSVSDCAPCRDPLGPAESAQATIAVKVTTASTTAPPAGACISPYACRHPVLLARVAPMR